MLSDRGGWGGRASGGLAGSDAAANSHCDGAGVHDVRHAADARVHEPAARQLARTGTPTPTGGTHRATLLRRRARKYTSSEDVTASASTDTPNDALTVSCGAGSGQCAVWKEHAAVRTRDLTSMVYPSHMAFLQMNTMFAGGVSNSGQRAIGIAQTSRRLTDTERWPGRSV